MKQTILKQRIHSGKTGRTKPTNSKITLSLTVEQRDCFPFWHFVGHASAIHRHYIWKWSLFRGHKLRKNFKPQKWSRRNGDSSWNKKSPNWGLKLSHSLPTREIDHPHIFSLERYDDENSGTQVQNPKKKWKVEKRKRQFDQLVEEQNCDSRPESILRNSSILASIVCDTANSHSVTDQTKTGSQKPEAEQLSTTNGVITSYWQEAYQSLLDVTFGSVSSSRSGRNQ
jgi:hypothetical protein